MRIWGLTESEITEGVKAISDAQYESNLYAENIRQQDSAGRVFTFVIRCHSSRGAGARLSASGRHTVAASWAAHRDVMRHLLGAAGATRILSAYADYRAGSKAWTVEDDYSSDWPHKRREYSEARYESALEAFDELHEGTKYINVGSMVAPVTIGDL